MLSPGLDWVGASSSSSSSFCNGLTGFASERINKLKFEVLCLGWVLFVTSWLSQHKKNLSEELIKQLIIHLEERIYHHHHHHPWR